MSVQNLEAECEKDEQDADLLDENMGRGANRLSHILPAVFSLELGRPGLIHSSPQFDSHVQ